MTPEAVLSVEKQMERLGAMKRRQGREKIGGVIIATAIGLYAYVAGERIDTFGTAGFLAIACMLYAVSAAVREEATDRALILAQIELDQAWRESRIDAPQPAPYKLSDLSNY